MTSNKNKDLINRLIILEKFLELKSNECAYYRSKVHLMQINSNNLQIKSNIKRSSSEDINQNQQKISVSLSSENFEKKFRNYSSIPFLTRSKRYRNKNIYSQNQNYYENPVSHSNQKLIEQTIISYLNKHLPQSNTTIETPQHTVLMIRLPRRLIRSLIAQQKKTSTSKLKVHFSTELINKLFQSIHLNSKDNNQFTIQSQYGQISACINHEKSQSKPIHVKAEVKTHHENRLPIIRHFVRTKSDDSNRKKFNSHRRKRHLHKSSSITTEELKKSSLTNVTQTIETLSSTDQTDDSITIEKKKKNKRNY